MQTSTSTCAIACVLCSLAAGFATRLGSSTEQADVDVHGIVRILGAINQRDLHCLVTAWR